MNVGRSNTSKTVSRALVDGQVSVVFQPIVDLLNGSVFAYEALARCKAKGLENPVTLFEVAAEQKLCGRLGRTIRELATVDCAEHPLFLNVHPHELADRYLVQPDDPIFTHEPGVYLEITESVPLSHHALVDGTLREVRSKGVGLVVDDLGAGYSNLRYIADLEPEIVKLDRGLIINLHEDPRRARLVASIVRLCGDLGARVVAEGVETTDELLAIVDAGVHYVQGYLLARPAHPPPKPAAHDSIPSAPGSRRGARVKSGVEEKHRAGDSDKVEAAPAVKRRKTASGLKSGGST
ncbi:MAG: EAL domain-containing protein [Polyangiaceae bacterium]|nr:EAL domain-containing protein [Polyangiaceae bacterium]